MRRPSDVATLLIVLLIYLDGRRSDSEPTVLDYREDMFFNLKWRWNYSGNKMVRMSCYCPYCDYQIVPVESEDFINGHTSNLKRAPVRYASDVPPDLSSK